MATTHIYNKLQDTSIYINLSSQNLHSAFAALKQEAKPLTTLNIKGLGDTKEEMKAGWVGGLERDGNGFLSEVAKTATGSCQRVKDFMEGGGFKCFKCKF